MDQGRQVERKHSEDNQHLTEQAEDIEPQFQTQEIIVQDVDSSYINDPDHSANIMDTQKSVDDDVGIKMTEMRNSVLQRPILKDCDIKQ